MKKIALILLCLALFGCSTVKVTYDYDRSADFSQFKTYAFSEESNDMGINELNRDRVLNAVGNELTLKGLNQSTEPDAIVDIHIKGKEVTTANVVTTGGMYGRYGWAGGIATTSVVYDTYTEGTMIISMIDKRTEKIFWQGVGSRTIDETASAEKREKNINSAVSQILAKFPPPAK